MSEPEHIKRQLGEVTRPEWCNCDDGYWMRALIDPQCHYHSAYGEELRELLVRAADALEKWAGGKAGEDCDCPYCTLVTELRKAAE